MKRFVTWLIGVHAVLLALASTRFTPLEAPLLPGTWTWNYARLAYTNGWGQAFHSDYPLSVVLTYVASYAVGMAAYGFSRRILGPGLSITGLALCALGLLSFVIEAGHYLFTYGLSIIMTVPLLSLPIAIVSLALVSKPHRVVAADVANLRV